MPRQVQGSKKNKGTDPTEAETAPLPSFSRRIPPTQVAGQGRPIFSRTTPASANPIPQEHPDDTPRFSRVIPPAPVTSSDLERQSGQAEHLLFSRNIPVNRPTQRSATISSQEPTPDKPMFSRTIPAQPAIQNPQAQSPPPQPPVFSRRIPAGNPGESAEGGTAGGNPVEQAMSHQGLPTFSRAIPDPLPMNVDSDATPEVSIFSRRIPPGNPVQPESGIPAAPEPAASPPVMPSHLAGSSELAHNKDKSSGSTTEGRRPIKFGIDTYHFVSPYVADHIIKEDRDTPGNRIFKPPRHAANFKTRFTDRLPDKFVSLNDRSSTPPPELQFQLNNVNFDSLKCDSNFDPPITYRYTKEQLEIINEMIQEKDLKWDDYQERVEVLSGAKRAELQLLMRVGSNLIHMQNENQEIRDLLEGALESMR